MSVLLSDASFCTNDFSRLLFSATSEWSIHAEVANITKAGSPLTQHTEYRIAITLYLHGTFPLFAPAKFFGNTEPAVIAERVDAITRFLNFVFASEVLRKAKVLHQFFEGATEILNPRDTTQPVSTPGLHPTESETSDELLIDSLRVPVDANDSGDPVIDVEQLLESHEPTRETAEDRLRAVPRDEQQMTTASASSGSLAHSGSSCLLFDFPEADFQVKVAGSNDASPSTSQSYLRGSHSSNAVAEEQTQRSLIRRVLPRIAPLSSHQAERRSSASSNHLTTPNVQRSSSSGSFFERTPITGLQTQSSSSASATAVTARFPFVPSLPSPAKGNDYLTVAAQFISAAQKAEAECAFELAFHCYKGAVKALLQGVQFERDLPRRNRVRKKTAKYLLKAEKLYRSYLSFDGSAFEPAAWLSDTVQDPNLIAFQSSNAVLKNFHVVAILPNLEAHHRVFLVEDQQRVCRNEQPVYVMKTLAKSSSNKPSLAPPACTIIPMDIPNMVQMHKFFDTENVIILLLEYIKRGQLWEFLKEYLEEQQQQIEAFLFGRICENETYGMGFLASQRWSSRRPVEEAAQGCSTVKEPGEEHFKAKEEGTERDTNSHKTVSRKNTYEGKHVRFSVGDGDEPADLTDVNEIDEEFLESTRKSSAFSRESLESVEDSFVTALSQPGTSTVSDSGQTTSTFNGPPSILLDASYSSYIDVPDVEEEAPAPITLCSDSIRSASTSRNCSESGEPSLSDALEIARETLASGRCWDSKRQLPEILIAHWVGQLVSAVYFLHSQGIIIRDLRPQNLLIDDEANLRLTYCSQWQSVECCIDENASLDFYAAPETASIFQKVDDAADRWSIGAILFELICGQKMSKICLHGFETLSELPIPDCVKMSFAARDLLSRLLILNPAQRISDDELRAHPFFEGIDWRRYDRVASDHLGKQA